MLQIQDKAWIKFKKNLKYKKTFFDSHQGFQEM